MDERTRQIQLKQSAGMTEGQAIDAVDAQEGKFADIAEEIADLGSDDEVRGILNILGLEDMDIDSIDTKEVEEALQKANSQVVNDIAKQVGVN